MLRLPLLPLPLLLLLPPDREPSSLQNWTCNESTFFAP
jgi:hypothetical protein